MRALIWRVFSQVALFYSIPFKIQLGISFLYYWIPGFSSYSLSYKFVLNIIRMNNKYWIPIFLNFEAASDFLNSLLNSIETNSETQDSQIYGFIGYFWLHEFLFHLIRNK